MKARYLTFFSYIGTSFRSAEKVWLKDGSKLIDPDSVQGLMEIGLLKLKSLNKPQVVLSSRTDGGVHALNSSAHIDLERRGTNIYDTKAIVTVLNSFFNRNNYPVTINNCVRVSDSFHARFNALSRSYLYRLAILKKDINISDTKALTSIIPIEEWRRCNFFVLPEFDIDKFKAAAAYFPGYHDFTSFKKHDKLKSHKNNRRQLYSVEVKPGNPTVTSYSLDHREKLFDYYDVHVHGRGFVHNQVKYCGDATYVLVIRRMLGAMIGVSVGKIPIEEIKVMLQVPSKNSWPVYLCTVPPHGLYLCNVEYDPKDLVYSPETEALKNTIESDSDNEM